jgi:SAM-dependent methyltransferase
MRKWLLDYLRCPVTRAPVRLADARCDGDQIIGGRLVTPDDAHEYPIIDGVPRMLPGIRDVADLRRVYADSFGYEWTTFNWSRTQDEREYFAVSDQTPETLAGRVVLDAGCGGGRVSRVIGQYCRRLVGLDYSVAVDRARRHTRDLDNCEFVQGDILHPPLAPERFDHAWSHGVLHHTESTQAGFAQLAALVAPGGTLHAIVFLKTIWPLRVSDGLLRRVLRKLPYASAARICRWMGVLRHLPAARFWKRLVWFSLQPTADLREYCNFDWYMPQYHHEHSVAEVQRWFRDAGFVAPCYINGWPDAPPAERFVAPQGWRRVRLGQLLGIVGKKAVPVKTAPEADLVAPAVRVPAAAVAPVPAIAPPAPGPMVVP